MVEFSSCEFYIEERSWTAFIACSVLTSQSTAERLCLSAVTNLGDDQPELGPWKLVALGGHKAQLMSSVTFGPSREYFLYPKLKHFLCHHVKIRI